MFNHTNTKILALALVVSSSAYAETEIKVKGDFRFRTENIKEEQASPTPEAERSRQRLRLRLAAQAKVNATTDVHVRFATGSTTNTETNSTNQDLTDYYSKKTIVLDQAYFDWKATDSLKVWGGKAPLAFHSVGGNDMIFDTDLTPEGLAAKYKHSLESGEIYFNTAMTWLNERYSASGATDNTDVGLVGAQLGFAHKAEAWNLNVNAASYNYSNIKGATAPAARGNTLSGGSYVNDYKVTSLGLEIGTDISEMPVSLYAESVNNSDPSTNNKGSIFGVKIGKLKDAGSWSLTIDSREVEKDATVGVLADSDSSGGGTDIRSTKLAGAYQVADNSNVALTVFSGKKTISSTTLSPNYQRVMLDFNYNF